MPFFRKKPVVIEAMQWTGTNETALPNFIPTHVYVWHAMENSVHIYTLEGVMRAMPGDWIIKGVNGEFYPCKPDIFEKTYEPMAPGDEERTFVESMGT